MTCRCREELVLRAFIQRLVLSFFNQVGGLLCTRAMPQTSVQSELTQIFMQQPHDVAASAGSTWRLRVCGVLRRSSLQVELRCLRREQHGFPTDSRHRSLAPLFTAHRSSLKLQAQEPRDFRSFDVTAGEASFTAKRKTLGLDRSRPEEIDKGPNFQRSARRGAVDDRHEGKREPRLVDHALGGAVVTNLLDSDLRAVILSSPAFAD